MTPPDQEREFTPIPNPFSTGVPVRNPKLFFGREDDFAYVRQRLIAEREGIVLLLVGGRRTGKTSILWQILGGRLGEGFLPILVDMQQLAGVTEDREFFGRLAQSTLEGVGDERLVLEYYDFSQGNPILTYDQLLEDVQKLFPQRLIFLVDEAEFLREKVLKGELSGKVLIYLASILERRRVSFCLCGSPGLGESEAEGWRHLLGKGASREISFLSRDDTLRLIQKPVEGQVFYAEGVVEAIYQLTFGHPFYTQVICTSAVDYLNQVRRNTVGLEDLDEVLRIVTDNPPPQLVYDWDVLDQGEHIVLSLLSEESQGRQNPVLPERLLQAIEEHHYPLDLKADTLHMTLEKLYSANVLQKDEGKGYYFRVDLFRHWVRRARSVWRLVEEMAPRKSRWPWRWAVAAGIVLVAGVGWWLTRAEPVVQQGEGSLGPAVGAIWVESDPPDVEVLVDGQLKSSRTPTMLQSLNVGVHVIELKRKDHHPWQDTVEVKAGDPDTLPLIHLMRLTGRLTVASTPPGAQVQVRGEKSTSGVTPLQGQELPTGEYLVEVQQAGFVSQPRKVVIREGVDTTLTMVLSADVGSLELVSSPPGARIYLNGIDQGRQTPATLEGISVGQHRLRLELQDYQAVEAAVEVRLNRTETRSWSLALKPATLDLVSEPANAAVSIEGTDTVQEHTPVAGLQLRPGHYRVRVEHEGYDSYSLEEELSPGERFAPPQVELKPQYGKVRIVKPLSGAILVDGATTHKIPPVDIPLQVGTHTLKVIGNQGDIAVQVFKDSTVKVSLP